MEPMISVRNLHKSFGTNTVLADISIDIFSQEVVVVIGPSGSGKSTFLRCLNLLEQPQAGEIVIEGTSLMAASTKINDIRTELGMVFQQFNLFPHMKVIENIMLAPVQVRKWSPDKARQKALELLQKVGLSEKAEMYPASLSGGRLSG